MSSASWVQFLVLVALLLALAPPLGRYMARVYGDDGRAPGDRVFLPVERFIYRLLPGRPEPGSSAGPSTPTRCSGSASSRSWSSTS